MLAFHSAASILDSMCDFHVQYERVGLMLHLYLYETEEYDWIGTAIRDRCPNRACWSKPDPDRLVELYDFGRYSTHRQNGTFGRTLTTSDWSNFDPPSPPTLGGVLIEIVGRNSTQLFSTVKDNRSGAAGFELARGRS